MLLLDTNAVSAWADSDPDLFRRVPMDRLWLVSTISLGEYRYGLLNSIRRAALETWLEDFEAEETILTPDAQTARSYAYLRHAVTRDGRTIPYHDLWIAALAHQYGLPVVSRDRHFDSIPGIRRVAW